MVNSYIALAFTMIEKQDLTIQICSGVLSLGLLVLINFLRNNINLIILGFLTIMFSLSFGEALTLANSLIKVNIIIGFMVIYTLVGVWY